MEDEEERINSEILEKLKVLGDSITPLDYGIVTITKRKRKQLK